MDRNFLNDDKLIRKNMIYNSSNLHWLSNQANVNKDSLIKIDDFLKNKVI